MCLGGNVLYARGETGFFRGVYGVGMCAVMCRGQVDRPPPIRNDRLYRIYECSLGLSFINDLTQLLLMCIFFVSGKIAGLLK